MPDIDRIDISKLVEFGETYICSRNLFSFVNRNLNTLGLLARVQLISQNDMIVFQIERGDVR